MTSWLFEPWPETSCCVPLSTQVYKWVAANVLLVELPGDGLASHPGGSRNTPSRFMLQKPEIGSSLMSHLVHMHT